MTINLKWYEHHGQIKEILGERAAFSFSKHNEEGHGKLVLWSEKLGVPPERIQELSNGRGVTIRPRGANCCELTGMPQEIISLLRSIS